MNLRFHSWSSFSEDIDDIHTFDNLKEPKEDFTYKNMIPIPTVLILTLLNTIEKSPFLVVNAFFDATYEFYDNPWNNPSTNSLPAAPDLTDNSPNPDNENKETETDTDTESTNGNIEPKNSEF